LTITSPSALNLVSSPTAPYKGWIPLRLTPEVHRRAAARAEAEGLSLNQWIAKHIEAAVSRP
jgi:predicted HicB family RNase H-like nuclease